ncbi:MAG TPA: tyrosine--tRNA ligase [Candidatus Dojkabacteria bacterium]|nr:tyrosine--tRNA ligase [Candidatus Dojkabacteria bacterium]
MSTQLSKAERIELITRNLQEVLGIEQLEHLIDTNTPLVHYIGYEISGLLHIGQGVSTCMKIADLQNAGVKCRIYLADWHTWINDKFGGDHELIKKVAVEYFEPAMRVSLKMAGGNPDEVEFIHGSDLYHNNDRYWQTVVEVSKNLTVSRVLKSTTIMGRKEDLSQPFAWLIYPPMQASDIVELGANIAHAGMDQRKVHVIAREVIPSLKINRLTDADGNNIKPVCIHNRLILGLQAPKTWPIPQDADENIRNNIRTQMKMSKSIPGSAIFIHDSEEEIREKIKGAFCPQNHTEFNPIVDWCRYLLLPMLGELKIKREQRFGGDMTIKNVQELEERYISGELFPLDLKNNVADILVDLLKPGRDAFASQEKQDIIQMIKDVKKKR